MQFVNFLPRQKLSESQKTKKWHVDCIDAGMGIINTYDNTRRTSRYTKKINYDLVSNIFHKEDLIYVINPLGLEENSVPAELRHYDTVSPIFSLLSGEESARTFNFLVRAINEEAISEKETKQKEAFFELITSIAQERVAKKLQGQQVSEKQQQEELQKELEKFNKYMNYEYQDIREMTATHILQYLKRSLDIDKILLDGWEDALVAGEEIYRVEILGKEPVVVRVNPMEVYYLMPHNSYYIDDSELIVEETWMSSSQIIDTYYDELTEEDIEAIETGAAWSTVGNELNYINPVIMHTQDVPLIDSVNQLYDYNSTLDSKGNKRVLRVTWKSKKKIGVLKFPNPLTGEEEEIIVNEMYKPLKGEKVEWLWVNEYREGTKIGASIYTRMGPCKVQRRSIDNLSKCKSPYVGTIYGGNNSKSVSLMDRLKTYVYLYDIIFYRTELALAKSIGKVMEFDISQIPRQYGFDVDKWLYYLQAMNISFINSSEESQKGTGTGMIQQKAANREIDLEQGQYIDRHISLLSFIEQKIYQIAGVTPQRLGQVGPREGVGNTAASIEQSSYITAKYFSVHDNVKRRVLEALLDVAKIAWRNDTKHIQYVTNDMGTQFLKVNGEDINSCEYGLFCSNTQKDNQTLEALKNIAQVAMQNDKLNVSQMIDIMMTDSINVTKNKIKMFEQEAEERRRQEVDAQNQAQQAQIEYGKEMKEREMELTKYEVDQNNITKLRVAELGALGRAEMVEGSDTTDILGEAELSLKQAESASKMANEQMGLNIKREESLMKHNLERQKIAQKDKEIASKEHIEKLKIDQIKEQNKSQEKIARESNKMKEKELAIKRIAARKKPSK